MGVEYFLQSIFFHHKIYLNGEQIFLDEKCIENIKSILHDPKNNNENNCVIINLTKLIIIRKIFEHKLPSDSVFLIGDKKVSKEEEMSMEIYNYIENNMVVNIFSPVLYKKNKYNKKWLNINELKIIKNGTNFNIIEYPQIEQKDCYSIIIYGDKNSNLSFINGFLNYLFDINVDDPYRFILEGSNNELKSELKNNTNNEVLNDFINIKYIKSYKCNFKIICFNSFNKFYIDSKSIEQIEKILDSLKVENYIDLLICNNTKNEIYLNENLMEKIFFCCPNEAFYFLKVMFLNAQMNFENKIKQWEKNFSEIVINIAELDEDIRCLFNACFLEVGSIYKDNKTLDNIFRFNITMKGYKYLYDFIIERKNNLINFDLSSVKRYLSYLKRETILIEEKIKIYEDNKREKLNLKKKKLNDNKNKLDEYENEKGKKKEKIKIIKNIISIYDTVLNYEKILLEDKYFTIPLEKENAEKEYNYDDDTKTNVCNKCKFNCHTNCKHLIKIFCTGAKCNKCPNKCPTSSHEIGKYKYINYQHKNIFDILKEFYPNYKKLLSSKIKIENLIQIIKEEKNKLLNECESLKNDIKYIEEKENLINEYNIKEDEDFFEIIEMNNKINEEIEKFNYNDFTENFDKEKIGLHTALLLTYIKKGYIDKDYTFIERPYSYSGYGGGFGSGCRC